MANFWCENRISECVLQSAYAGTTTTGVVRTLWQFEVYLGQTSQGLRHVTGMTSLHYASFYSQNQNSDRIAAFLKSYCKPQMTVGSISHLLLGMLRSNVGRVQKPTLESGCNLGFEHATGFVRD